MTDLPFAIWERGFRMTNRLTGGSQAEIMMPSRRNTLHGPPYTHVPRVRSFKMASSSAAHVPHHKSTASVPDNTNPQHLRLIATEAAKGVVAVPKALPGAAAAAAVGVFHVAVAARTPDRMACRGLVSRALQAQRSVAHTEKDGEA